MVTRTKKSIKAQRMHTQITMEGLPHPVVPKTGIKIDNGRNLGTSGLPLFEREKEEERIKQQSKQANLL